MTVAALFADTASITAALTDFAVRVVGDLGLAGVFVLMLLDGCCVPIPSEATLLFAGFGVSQGRYGLLAVVVAGTLGNVVGSQLAYGIGRWGRSGPLARRGSGWHATALARSQDWFDRYGRSSVFFGRLMPLVRTFISLPAGIARMPFGTFTLLTVLGCLPWVLALALLGDAVGHNWKQWKDHLSYVDYAVVAVAIGAAIAWLVTRARRSGTRRRGARDDVADRARP
ncbi:MAG: DedA family protein [Solirubrobacteraceae bacterium]